MFEPYASYTGGVQCCPKWLFHYQWKHFSLLLQFIKKKKTLFGLQNVINIINWKTSNTDSTDHIFFNLRSLHHINLQVDDFNLVVNQNTPLLQLFSPSGFFKLLVHKSPVCSEWHKKKHCLHILISIATIHTKLVTKPHHSCAHIQATATAINKSQHYRMALIVPGLFVLYSHGLLTNKPSEVRSETWKYSNPDTDFHIRCNVSDSLPVLQLFLFWFGFFKHSFMDMWARQRLTTYILSFVTLQTFCMHKKICKMLNGTLKIVKIDMAKQFVYKIFQVLNSFSSCQ